MELLLKNNPSCLEILATQEEYILYKSPLLDELNYKDLVPPNIQLGNLTTWEEVRYAANQ